MESICEKSYIVFLCAKINEFLLSTKKFNRSPRVKPEKIAKDLEKVLPINR